MNKIIIIGCPGSGKSTFARELHNITDIPLFHLDLLYWKEDKTTVSKESFKESLQKIMSGDSWIIDGNYASTMEMRMKECDSVFFLDYPTEICLDGIKKRHGQKRFDMPWIETEYDKNLIDFIKNYNNVSRPAVFELFENYKFKNIIIFKSREEADLYLKSYED